MKIHTPTNSTSNIYFFLGRFETSLLRHRWCILLTRGQGEWWPAGELSIRNYLLDLYHFHGVKNIPGYLEKCRLNLYGMFIRKLSQRVRTVLLSFLRIRINMQYNKNMLSVCLRARFPILEKMNTRIFIDRLTVINFST